VWGCWAILRCWQLTLQFLNLAERRGKVWEGWVQGGTGTVVLAEVSWGGATIGIFIQGNDTARTITLIVFYSYRKASIGFDTAARSAW